jgi:glutamate synthase domain-containing protein 1
MDGLYDPRFEHDSCGVGFVATTAGRSHMVLQRALEAVANLTHRGAVSADGKTGDGAGVLTQIPHQLLAPELHRLGARVTRHTDLGVGMIFLPRDSKTQVCARAVSRPRSSRKDWSSSGGGRSRWRFLRSAKKPPVLVRRSNKC